MKISGANYKYLFKNIGILTISDFGSKILSFILIPLYTGELTTAEYGIYDLYVTTIALVVPVLTLNILDAVLRFSLDKEYDSKKVLSIGVKLCTRAVIIFYTLIFINEKLGFIEVFSKYPFYLGLYMIATMLYDILKQFARGIECIYDIAVAGIINSVTMLVLNIYFLKILKLGITGYFLANCVANLVPFVYLLLRIRIWHYISFTHIDRKLEKDMTFFSKPLIFNTVAWWVNNVSDRYIVTFLCGVAVNGVYSLAYKIPSILNVFQTIFGQAWTLSAVKEFDEKNATFYENIYRGYNAGMVLICSLLIIADRVLAKVLFANRFYNAWLYAPWLMMSVVFGALSSVFGGIFTASKKTQIMARTTIIGASVNIILSYILVHIIGASGAAIATLISYIVVWFGRFISIREIIDMRINVKRDIISYILLLIQTVLLIILRVNWGYLFQIILFVMLVTMYSKECGALIKWGKRGGKILK